MLRARGNRHHIQLQLFFIKLLKIPGFFVITHNFLLWGEQPKLTKRRKKMFSFFPNIIFTKQILIISRYKKIIFVNSVLFDHPSNSIFKNLVVKWLNYEVFVHSFNVCNLLWASTMLHNIQLDCTLCYVTVFLTCPPCCTWFHKGGNETSFPIYCFR